MFISPSLENARKGPGSPKARWDTAAERERVQDELITELDHFLVHLSRSDKVMMNGGYTLTGPSAWGPEF